MAGYTGSKPVLLSTTAASVTGNATIGGDFTVDTDTLYVDSTNNRVGIGTGSPDENLHVAGGFPAIKLDNTDSGGNSWRIASGDTGSGFAGKLQVYNEDTATVAMMIESSGNLLVGTTSSPDGTSVYGSGFVGETNSRMVLRCAGSSTAQVSVARFYNPNGQVGEIKTQSSSTLYVTSSDYRLKTDAQPMTGASARVQVLKPVNFEWIASGERVDGFLAHEAQAVVPECATGTKDAVDADGNPEYQGIDQSKLVPLLTAALQEALTEISDLKTRVAALEAV